MYQYTSYRIACVVKPCYRKVVHDIICMDDIDSSCKYLQHWRLWQHQHGLYLEDTITKEIYYDYSPFYSIEGEWGQECKLDGNLLTICGMMDNSLYQLENFVRIFLVPITRQFIHCHIAQGKEYRILSDVDMRIF